MEARKKRALLARIEGQLAAMDHSDEGQVAVRRQRIDWALNALAEMPLAPIESEYLSRLQHHVERMQHDAESGLPQDLISHRRTLIRTDCMLWQLQLRHRRTQETRAA